MDNVKKEKEKRWILSEAYINDDASDGILIPANKRRRKNKKKTRI